MADGLDKSTEREVVVGDQGDWRVFARRDAVGVVVRKADDLQPRHLTFGLETF